MNYRHSDFHFHGVLCKAERRPLRADPTDTKCFCSILQHKEEQYIRKSLSSSPSWILFFETAVRFSCSIVLSVSCMISEGSRDTEE